jgi:hypothetical protein
MKASAISDALRVLVCDFTHNLAAGGTINWPRGQRKSFVLSVTSGEAECAVEA